MPLIEVTMYEGRPRETKRKLIEAITSTVCETLGTTPEKVWVVIREEPKENLGIAGKPLA
jgi:4-oxalocrotonate tautomerase